MKTISRRKNRKATGTWAPHVKELRTRIEGIGKDGKPRLSQAEFGKIFRSASITISRWELGTQDPPGPMLKWLALAAGNLGYRDLEMIFNAGQPTESTITQKDRNIVLLLACLMRWKDVSSPGDRNADIHRAGRAIFELARTIVADAVAPQQMNLAGQMLIAEMSRLLEAVHNDEHQFYSPTLRAAGLPMYSEGEADFTEISRAKEIRKRQLERDRPGEWPEMEGSKE